MHILLIRPFCVYQVRVGSATADFFFASADADVIGMGDVFGNGSDGVQFALVSGRATALTIDAVFVVRAMLLPTSR